MMKYMDLYKGYEIRKEAIDKRIESIIKRAQFIFGDDLEELEKTLSDYVGIKYAVGVSSGHDALQIALMALGFEAGTDLKDKEVIVPAMTFFSTAEAPAFLGMKVVVCDIDKDTYNMDLEKLEKLINKNTACIIPVNLFGQCIDYNRLNETAKKHNVFVIEDACQSFGAKFKGIKSCNFGNISVTSFFPAKTLGGFGDGGMAFTNDEKLYKRLKQLRHHGDEGGMTHVMLGTTGRLDNLQAGILCEKFKDFDKYIAHRIAAADYYTKELNGVVKTPVIAKDQISVYAQYVIGIGEKRDEIKSKLTEKGVPTALYYPNPIHLAPILKHLGYKAGDMPNAEYACKNNLAIPIYNEISKEEQDFVISAIKSVMKE